MSILLWIVALPVIVCFVSAMVVLVIVAIVKEMLTAASDIVFPGNGDEP